MKAMVTVGCFMEKLLIIAFQCSSSTVITDYNDLLSRLHAWRVADYTYLEVIVLIQCLQVNNTTTRRSNTLKLI